MAGVIGCQSGEPLPEYRGAAFSKKPRETSPAPQRGPVSLTDQVQHVAAEVTRELGDSVLPSAASFPRTLDTVVMRLSSRLFMVTDIRTATAEVVRYLFEELGIVLDKNDDDPRTLFPHTVLARRQGSCLGMSLLVLVLAEKLDLAMHGVLVPGHFFVRCTDGSTSFNLETIKKGESFDNAWYRERYDISEQSRYSALSSLTREEVGAVLLYNVGNACRARDRHDLAVRYYQRAVHEMPSFAEAWGNMGVSLAALGEDEHALAALEKAREMDPALPNLASNIAAAAARLAKHEQALEEFRRAARERPDDPEVLYGLAYACLGTGRYDEARTHALRVIELRGEDSNAAAIAERAQDAARRGSGTD